MANFPGPRFLLLVLAGLALCQGQPNTQTTMQNSTQSPATPTNSSQVSSGQSSGSADPETGNTTSGLPTSTMGQNQTVTSLNKTETGNTTSGLLTSTMGQNQTDTSPKGPETGNTTSGLLTNTMGQNQTVTSLNKTETGNTTSGLPTSTMDQNQTVTSLNKTETGNTTSGLLTSTMGQNQTDTSPKGPETGNTTSGLLTNTMGQNQTVTSLNKTETGNTTSGLPTSTMGQNQTDTSPKGPETGNTTSGLLTNTMGQNQTVTSLNKTETGNTTSGLLTSTMGQNQTVTSLNKTETGNTTSGLPTSTMGQNQTVTSPKGPETGNTLSGLPTSTMGQNQTVTSLNKTETDNNTSGLLTITTGKNQTDTSSEEPENVNSSTSSPTSSSTITTSPTLTSSTTTGPKCTYSIYQSNDLVKVEITGNVTDDYTITLTDKGNQNTTIPLGRKRKYQIKHKSLKPCQTYTVSLTPSCNPNGNTTFKTRELVDSDVDITLTEQVCFDTIWNLASGNCIQITMENACKSNELKFEDNSCSKSVSFTFPPVKPTFDYIHALPTKFTWTNRPTQCANNLTYSCTGVTDLNSLKPFQNYNCTGTYHFENGIITSDSKTVRIECDMKNGSVDNITNSNIRASWDFTSKHCPNISNNITLNATCTNHTAKSVHCSRDSCDIVNLEPYTTYECTLKASYGNNNFRNFSFTNKTISSKPTVKEQMKVTELKHNSFQINCEIIKWNGEKGDFTAILEGVPLSEQTKKVCEFVFKDLNYLTAYKVKVTAKNNNGNISEPSYNKFTTKYNDKAVLGFLSFLIIVTSIALLFVLYKIYLLKREKSSRNEQELDDLLPTNALLQVEPMTAEDLLDAYKKKRADEGRLFMDEFQSVPRIFSNFSVREAKKPENQTKNRYVDILPYDYNRVSLSHGGTEDYINASFIEGYKESNKYIAAQGPKEETVGDFWTMIWEQKTSIIVMVTRCEEGNKNKCAQYWPSLERETEIFDDLVVKIKGEEKCPDYIIRHLTLMNRKEKSAEREVTHIQFTSWPDHGVPSDPGLLLKLRRRVNSFKNFFSGPIVIHCSAGVGRTGTYICIDAMIESLEAEGRVDIYGYVVKLRRQRCLMVQVEAQYVLIHTALIEYSQFGETEMALSNFHSEVNTLRQKEGNDPSFMELEFQKLPKFKNYRTSNTARTEENKKKNRSSIVPYDFNRVPIKVNDEVSHDSEAEDEEEYSSDEEDEVPTKYINASYVDGYWLPSSFIVAQGPTDGTVADFLHMLFQKQVKTVFMLSDCTENDKEFCSQYWDDEKKTFGEIVVEVKETENTPTYIRRCLEIQHTKRKDSHTLQQYHFQKWAGQELPSNPLDLVDMMRSVRQSSDNINKHKNLPILAHCNDGSSRSGIFCALWKLLDSADTEKLVDIFQVAKDLRKARMGMFNTFEQYKFLYAALEAAYPVQNGEVKKPREAPTDTVQVINESTALIMPSTGSATEKGTESKEGTDSVSPEEGATEASKEPEKVLSESTPNGPTATEEAESV
ncbi:receptor-type tyrosine-protein phosphatase C isoform X11 [Hemibagrus wyckioides]|uniref:receptor-type tyrosine-protein phosphatase C isoform X11 n=1 Tax=Hemibagrus wyckioides TaxID=337641 RepID=UPI00266BB801|nr:receptor-type tyrosine-protein phosphatase C isoform X11 [Hemibagrus wyckioides]